MTTRFAFRLPSSLFAATLLLPGCVSTPAPRIPLDNLPPSQVELATRNLRVFNSVWSMVADKHYDAKLAGLDWRASGEKFGPLAAAAPDKKALYAVLNDMLEPLHDSHTHALTPEQADERHTQIRARTGINLTRFDGRWAVADLVPGSPAELGGVQRGWIVVARNGQKLGPRNDFRANDGEVAQWEFLDEKDHPITIALTARRLSTKPRQEALVLDGGYVYLRFDGFDGPDRRWLGEQLKAHLAAPGVIIDLRQNPGGETFSLGITVGEFFDHAVDCGTFVTRSGSRSEKNSWQIGSAHYAGRVAILIDGPTASAAEIFSAVLQDHGRATVVGRKSAGALLASWFYVLPDGGELQLSREDYFAPKGRRIEGVGVEPDIKVTRSLEDLRARRDPDIDAALRALRGS